MVNFIVAFVLLAVVCFVLYVASDFKGQSAIIRRELAKFQWKFLRVYLLAVAGDWLQGPHVYALYQSYGMQKHEIELLFAVGFGSSMIFGTVVGAFADTFRAADLLKMALIGEASLNSQCKRSIFHDSSISKRTCNALL
ncbi:major facilitator superfamily domain-containing protein 5 [Trichinella spiralis]|uniref:major facilitator superfamily domain-containing protein 5 n=1 Tax=Trichinella spiralis TaxID=6334 RepID=UPI0001EFB42F|nr:major facilitator superfamily domain-containing protein 5 [Trichinella spiralis]